MDSVAFSLKTLSRTRLIEGWALVVVCATLTIAVASVSRPLKSHESFVLQTAREMSARKDWIVPYYNDELRLTKPPLGYWITMAVSRIDPFHDDVLPMHGRTASILAGLGMALFTMLIGMRFYGRRVGLLAAMLLVTSYGYTRHGGNARPDCLYAFFCAVQLFAWIEARRSKDGSREQCWKSWGGWVAAALATLTKGPQIPLLFIVGLLFHLIRNREHKRILKILRPISGLLIFFAIVAPWWILLQRRLLETGQSLGDTQLSGTLLQQYASWKDLVSLYYVREILKTLVPWSLFIPFLILWRKRRALPKDPTILLITVCIITLLALTAFGHYRRHYLLPLYPAFFLLIAAFVDSASLRFSEAKLSRLLVLVERVSLAICICVMIWQGVYFAMFSFLAFFGLLALFRKRELRNTDWSERPSSRQLLHLTSIAVLLLVGLSGFAFWDSGDYLERSFYEYVGKTVRSEDLLAVDDPDDDALVYYANCHGVIPYSTPEDLKRYISQNQQIRRVFVILLESELPLLGETFQASTQATLPDSDHPDETLVFVELRNDGSVLYEPVF